MDLYPQRMEFNGGVIGKITFEDETGTTIESNGGLVLMAKEGIRLESMTGIAMQGMSDIMALYAEGASSLCVNGSVDMLGRLAGISASKYTGYPPYDDAPKEGEFDWDGFTRNLAIGLGVVAVCAIGAAISIATLGIGSILAGVFIGAGIGALSTTAIKVGEEISTGNVRSAKEAFRDVGISAASGFVTGAFGAKFPGAHRLVEGVVDTVVSAGERYLYAVFDDSMSREEKWAYALDPRQMVADFVTGVVIGEILDGIMAAIQNKLRSIFANYDAALREALESGRKADFYVTSSGDVVPATGYRYMDSGRANDAIISGEQYTTYIGFKKYDSAPQVKDAFQIADSWSDCKVRGEFDTLQVIDDLYVPTTKGNTTAIPEPITFSYPEYGKGGEHQLRVDKGIKFTNVDFIGDYKNE